MFRSAFDKNLIFLHLPKNGGSSLRPILRRYFDSSNKFTIRLVRNDKLNIDTFVNLPENKRAKIRYLQGHMSFGLHKYMQGPTDYVTILRKPVDRIISFYYYVLSLPEHRLHREIVDGNMSLYDFAQRVNEPDVHNAQVRFISGLDDRGDLMLEKALENIEHYFPVVGLLEQYNTSLILLKEVYHLHTPYYRIENRSKGRKKVEELPTSTTQLIEELNREDNLLYQAVEERFAKQIEQVGADRIAYGLKKLELANRLYNAQWFMSGEKRLVNTKQQIKQIIKRNY